MFRPRQTAVLWAAVEPRAADDTGLGLLIRRCKCPSGCDRSSKGGCHLGGVGSVWPLIFGLFILAVTTPLMVALMTCHMLWDVCVWEVVKKSLSNQHQVGTGCSSSQWCQRQLVPGNGSPTLTYPTTTNKSSGVLRRTGDSKKNLVNNSPTPPSLKRQWLLEEIFPVKTTFAQSARASF